MNRLLLILFLILLSAFLLLACRDEAAPGDLDPDLSEDIPIGQGTLFRWEGAAYPYQIGEYRVLNFWGSRMTLQAPSGRQIHGTYLRTLNKLQPDGTRLNEIRFYPEGARRGR
jgi:hypothetical protein